MNNAMVRLSTAQLDKKIEFISNYCRSLNAATGSIFDANANVSSKNISTLHSELHKDLNIQINRHLMHSEIQRLFGLDLADEYFRQLEEHEIYTHDETNIYPYCVSISMYPFLLNGMRDLGGESLAPKHLDSYCGSFINLVFAISSQFAGAIATVEFLMHFDYFARKDFGNDYLKTARKKVDASLQHVIYSLNQPAAARGFQSVFWNISLFDRYFFNSIFDGFVYPGTDDRPNYQSIMKLQKYFLNWFNKERERSLLTFPVITCALLNGKSAPKDRVFANLISKELSQGNSFFIYQSDSVDSLASCCRVRNAFQEAPEFSYTLGAGGVATGSVNVMTININRLIQDKRNIREEVKKIHKYQYAYRQLIKKFIEDKMIPAYDTGYIFLDKQYSTIGIMGMVEAAEFSGISPSNNGDYKKFISSLLRQIYDENRAAKKTYGISFNTEMVPGESLGVKFAKWDSDDGYVLSRNCYNSYFYPVESSDVDIYDKFVLHGRDTIEYLDGGSALHINLEDSLTQDVYYRLLKLAVRTGCSYWTVNVKSTVCEDCGYISKRTDTKCIKCKSSNIVYATRIIGYLKKVSSFSYDRQLEHTARHYHEDTSD